MSLVFSRSPGVPLPLRPITPPSISPWWTLTSPGGFNSDGLEAQKKVMADLRAAYPDGRVVLNESHFMKDVSFHLWTHTGTNTGPGSAPPTGKSVTNKGSTLIRYRDGKIAEEIVCFDALDWQFQLGYTLTPPATGGMPAAQ